MRVLFFLALCGSLSAQQTPVPLPYGNDVGFIVLPDQQDNVQQQADGLGNYWSNQVTSILSQQATYNLQFVMSVGDVTNYCTTPEYATLLGTAEKPGVNQLDAAGLPVVIVGGNHDTTADNRVSYAECAANWETFASIFYADKPYMIASYGQHRIMLFSVALGTRPLLVIAYSPHGKFDGSSATAPTTGEITTALVWLDAQIATWRAANPTGLCWSLIHAWWAPDPAPGFVPSGAYSNWVKTRPYLSAQFSGHHTVLTEHWNYTAYDTGLGNTIHMMQLNYQLGSAPNLNMGTYALFRVDEPSGTVHGAAYTVAPSPNWWGTPELDSVAFGFGWPLHRSKISGRTRITGRIK